jgi:DNA-binding CsgD family transcriptional regulator
MNVMRSLDRREAARVAEMSAELDTVRIGARSAVDDIVSPVRELLDVDNAAIYAFADATVGLSYERWHGAGDINRIKAPFLSACRSLGGVFYDPRCPQAPLRNRVVDAITWIDRAGPETWLRSPLCRTAFVPLGLQHHRHLRVLVCDGAELLGWFGTILPGRPARRHARLLAALVPALRRRLIVERRLAAGPRALGALDAALAKIGAPAFVITARGVICEANAAGRALLDRDRTAVVTAIENVRARRPDPLRIELTPIAAHGGPAAWLAIVSGDSPGARIEHAIAAAACRWELTPRQRAVLEQLARGHANATIAMHLGVSTRAVELHVTALLDRAGVDSRAALVAAVLTR